MLSNVKCSWNEHRENSQQNPVMSLEQLYTKARLFLQLIVSQGSRAAMQLTPRDWDNEALYDSK